MRPRSRHLVFALLALLPACAKPIYIVHLPKAGGATGHEWQEGTALPPQTIAACNALDEEKRAACEYTETSCTEGIHSIKLSVLSGKTAEIVVTCLAYVPVDEGGL